jgi:hypothetical protein
VARPRRQPAASRLHRTVHPRSGLQAAWRAVFDKLIFMLLFCVIARVGWIGFLAACASRSPGTAQRWRISRSAEMLSRACRKETVDVCVYLDPGLNRFGPDWEALKASGTDARRATSGMSRMRRSPDRHWRS